jgi:hypothetical protein
MVCSILKPEVDVQLSVPTVTAIFGSQCCNEVK